VLLSPALGLLAPAAALLAPAVSAPAPPPLLLSELPPQAAMLAIPLINNAQPFLLNFIGSHSRDAHKSARLRANWLDAFSTTGHQ
jgi:hypothetical protein